MTDTMKERIARVIDPLAWESIGTLTHSQVERERESSLRRADAVLDAMREPDDAMRAFNGANWGHRTWSEYTAMIDAAISEGKE